MVKCPRCKRDMIRFLENGGTAYCCMPCKIEVIYDFSWGESEICIRNIKITDEAKKR